MYAGKSKVKSKGRTPKGAGEVDLEVNSPLGMSTVVGGGGGRGLLSGSAPATPTETDSSCNQSTTGAGPGGGWSRNSLRGSKCNSFKDEKKKNRKRRYHYVPNQPINRNRLYRTGTHIFKEI